MGLPFLAPAKKPWQKEYPDTDEELIRKLNIQVLSCCRNYAELLESNYAEVLYEVSPCGLLTRNPAGQITEYGFLLPEETYDEWAVLTPIGCYGRARDDTPWAVVVSQSDQIELTDPLRELLASDDVMVSECYEQCCECEKWVDTADTGFVLFPDDGDIMCDKCHIPKPSCQCQCCECTDWTADDIIDERERMLLGDG